MSVRNSHSLRRLEDIAADWIARRNAGLSREEAQQLAAWRAADPRHEAAFAGVDTLWSALNEPRRQGNAEELWRRLQLPRRAPARRRGPWLATFAAGALAVVMVGLIFLRAPTLPTNRANTIVVRPDRQVLPDGSIVELNANAEIAVEFAPGRRAVRLLQGEAMFHVKKDPSRPFIVIARDVAVRAVGTVFAVRMEPQHVGVLVTEGRVAVQQHPAAAPSVADVQAGGSTFVDAGGQLRVPPVPAPLAVERVPPDRIAQALAWRERRLEFIDTPLPDALKLFNQHNRVQFVLGDAALQQRSLTGIFWSDDPDTFARLLESGFNIRTERAGDAIVLRDARPRH